MNRHCPKCNTTKPLTLFGVDNSQKDGYSRACRECNRLRVLARRRSLGVTPRYVASVDGKQLCTLCGIRKPFAELCVVHKRPSGYGSTCRDCDRAQSTARRRSEGAKPRRVTLRDGEQRCWVCSAWKPLDDFALDGTRKSGREPRCRACTAEIRAADAPKRAGKAAAYARKRRAADPAYRVMCALRARVGQALAGKVKSARTRDLLGCGIPELRAHLESLFVCGMSWDNYGKKGWHIDHILPCASFDLTDKEQQRACFHYTNLQPLWAHDNHVKSNTLGPSGVDGVSPRAWATVSRKQGTTTIES